MSEQSDAVKKWRKNCKIRIIAAMGGCCQICSYNKCPEALELHHLDPNEKEISFGKVIANPVSWDKKIVPELRKCILLCANCHREYHNGYTEIPKNFSIFDEDFSDYRKNNDELKFCPVCSNKMAHHLSACSLRCSANQTGNLVKSCDIPLKELSLEVQKNKTLKELSEIFNCSVATIKRYKKKLNADILGIEPSSRS